MNLEDWKQVRACQIEENLRQRPWLVPWNRLDPDRHKEISRKGGINSGIARRKKKAEREQLEAIFVNVCRRAALEDECFEEYEEFRKWKRAKYARECKALKHKNKHG